jgi:hypothetical protein
MSKIKYLAHPVSIEVKKKWNAKGYKVVDSKFDPNPEQEKPKPKRESKSD